MMSSKIVDGCDYRPWRSVVEHSPGSFSQEFYKEFTNSSRKRYGCVFMAGVEPWLREQQQLALEQLVKKIICGQISSSSSAWKEEVDTNNHADMIVELDFKREGQEWKMFREEAEEIGVNIELAIFGVLVEEVLLDLVHL
jgi:hypothetical protein